jgi:hypothetical protein
MNHVKADVPAEVDSLVRCKQVLYIVMRNENILTIVVGSRK